MIYINYYRKVIVIFLERLFFNDNHPLKHMLPIVKDSSRRLRNKSSLSLKCNTERFKNSFFNRLIFKYKLHVNKE